MNIKVISSIIILCNAILVSAQPNILEEKLPVKIGIIDSGISSSSGISVGEKYNFITNTDDAEDDTGHGTALASIVSSVSPDAEIVALKVSGKEYITSAEITAAAIYKAVDVYKCDILLLSFGQPDTKILYDAVKYAYDNGVIMVSAVGNEGHIKYKKNKIYYPSGYDEVIGVGSVNSDGIVSLFSQVNKSVFVVTKGENIEAVNIDGTMRQVTGTSFSAASIAGLAAKIRAESQDKFKEYLKTYAIDKGEIGFDLCYGWGLIDFENLSKEEKNDIEN